MYGTAAVKLRKPGKPGFQEDDSDERGREEKATAKMARWKAGHSHIASSPPPGEACHGTIF